jgi:hypothetical protein
MKIADLSLASMSDILDQDFLILMNDRSKEFPVLKMKGDGLEGVLRVFRTYVDRYPGSDPEIEDKMDLIERACVCIADHIKTKIDLVSFRMLSREAFLTAPQD